MMFTVKMILPLLNLKDAHMFLDFNIQYHGL